MDNKKVLSPDMEQMITLILAMRDLQKDFFAGKRSVVGEAKKAEKKVDDYVNKMLSEAGTSPTEWQKRPPSTKQEALF